MTLRLEFSPDLEDRLTGEAAVEGMPIEKYAISVLEQGHPAAFRREELAAELQAWIEAGSSEKPDDDVLQQLDTDRSSNRRLNLPELTGVTW